MLTLLLLCIIEAHTPNSQSYQQGVRNTDGTSNLTSPPWMPCITQACTLLPIHLLQKKSAKTLASVRRLQYPLAPASPHAQKGPCQERRRRLTRGIQACPPEAFRRAHQRHSGLSNRGILACPREAFKLFHQRHSGLSTRGIQAFPPEAFKRVHQRHSGVSTRGILARPPEAFWLVHQRRPLSRGIQAFVLGSATHSTHMHCTCSERFHAFGSHTPSSQVLHLSQGASHTWVWGGQLVGRAPGDDPWQRAGARAPACSHQHKG